jgi:hypothetical protein
VFKNLLIARRVTIQCMVCALATSNPTFAKFDSSPTGWNRASATGELHGAEFIVSIAGKRRLGKAMPFSLTFRNNGDLPFFVESYGYGPVCRLELINLDTKTTCALLPFGKTIVDASTKMGGGQHGYDLLKKGARTTKSWTFDLSQFFALTHGNFVLHATTTLKSYPERRPFDVKVDDLFFDIAE